MNAFGVIGIFLILAGLWLLGSKGLTPGKRVVQDQTGAFTFTDDWGRPQTQIIYTWDKHVDELAFAEWLENNEPDYARVWTIAK